MNRLMVGVVGVLVLGLGASLFVWRTVEAQRPRGTDTEQLQRMLYEGERAAERKDAGGVTRYISNDYQDAVGLSDSAVRYEIASYIRRQRQTDLTIPGESVQINIDPSGKTGTVAFQMEVRTQGESGGTNTNSLGMTLRVAKEPVRYLWLFPGEEWKVVSSEGYSSLE